MPSTTTKRQKAAPAKAAAQKKATVSPPKDVKPKIARKKNPVFKRVESDRLKRLDPAWRRPRGINNKAREKRRGWQLMPTIGYRNPKATRGLHPSGLSEVLVHRPEDLDGLDPKVHGVRIAHTVGMQKRITIKDKADSLGLIIFNPLRLDIPREPLKTEAEKPAEEEVESSEKPVKAKKPKKTSGKQSTSGKKKEKDEE